MKFTFRANSILLLLLLFAFSCQKEHKSFENEKNKNESTRWIEILNSPRKGDSTKFILYNKFRLDTTRKVSSMITAAFFTYKNISKEALENIAKNEDIEVLKKHGFHGADITKKDSMIFYHKFEETGRKYLSGFILDRALIDKNDTLAGIKQSRRFIKLDFEVIDK